MNCQRTIQATKCLDLGGESEIIIDRSEIEIEGVQYGAGGGNNLGQRGGGGTTTTVLDTTTTAAAAV